MPFEKANVKAKEVSNVAKEKNKTDVDHAEENEVVLCGEVHEGVLRDVVDI